MNIEETFLDKIWLVVNDGLPEGELMLSGNDQDKIEQILKEYHKVKLKNLALSGVMQWVLIDKDNLPPLHKHVVLYDISNDNQKNVFVHTGTSLESYRHWTHYAEIKKPFA